MNFKFKISNLKLTQEGFTFPELVIVMGIVLLLLGFITINLVRAQNSSSLTSALTTLVTDIKSQQLKAMVGDTEGRGMRDSYGIHFASNQYVLFHGSTYNSLDSTNLAIPLDANLTFTSITFPNGNIVFSQESGTVSAYTNSTNSLVLQTSSGSQTKTITINQYGVVTQVN